MADRRSSRPAFSRAYMFVSARAETAGTTDHRRELLAGLAGNVIEVGCGNGLNFGHYPPTVTAVTAVEPERHLRAAATRAARSAAVPITVVEGAAESLPVPGGAYDAAVASLVLCSVADLPRALAEIRRVVRPGGELRFYEHVLDRDPRRARRQRRLSPVWQKLAGGCHPDRPTVAAITASGFSVDEVREFDFCPAPRWLCGFVAPHVIGRAR